MFVADTSLTLLDWWSPNRAHFTCSWGLFGDVCGVCQAFGCHFSQPKVLIEGHLKEVTAWDQRLNPLLIEQNRIFIASYNGYSGCWSLSLFFSMCPCWIKYLFLKKKKKITTPNLLNSSVYSPGILIYVGRRRLHGFHLQWLWVFYDKNS